MPNWCSNRLTIEGDDAELERFYHANKHESDRSALSFERLLPRPTEVNDDKSGWSAVDWSNEHWGTKWDVDANLERGPGHLDYSFDSAWGPPKEWFRAVARWWPQLTMRLWYAEGGCDFGGYESRKGDELLESEETTYRKAMVEEYGSVTDSCQYCEQEYTCDDADPEVRDECPQCVETRCVHCGKWADDHVSNQCLFDSTTYTTREQAKRV